jgi:hypothetical protein
LGNGKIWLLALVLVSVGMCFGAALFHWNCSKLHNCEGPFDFFGSSTIASGATPAGAAAPAVQPAPVIQESGGKVAGVPQPSSEEHLLKLQETVLHEIEASNAKTKEMLDFALLTVGFVGSLIIAIFGYFGWTTAQEIKEQKAKAADLIKSLGEGQKQADDALAKFKGAQAAIASDILSSIAPRLGQIANYGMKIAEFAGSQWESMSHEDRIRNCLEAADALKAAELGEEASAALSFIRARQGTAFLAVGDLGAAVNALEESCRCNVRNKPDRPYNLACAYAKFSQVPGSTDSYTDKAVALLKQCLDLCTNEPIGSTISRAYFLAKIKEDDVKRRDSDLDPIRNSTKFKEFVAAQ